MLVRQRLPLWREALAKLTFIVLAPLIFRFVSHADGGFSLGIAKALGLDNDYKRFAGLGGVADIVQIPAVARALLEPDLRAYDSLNTLFPLVGRNLGARSARYRDGDLHPPSL